MNKKRVGIYLRLSNEDRDKLCKDDSESIKNQRNMLMEYIRKNDLVLVDEYCDEDLSGAGTYRPEFERLIRDCYKHRIEIVLCKSQSRFSRDMEIVERYINNKFIQWDIRFIGLVDNADTDNMGNKKARQINGLVNEWYLEDVSNNIRSALKIKMREGELISPFAVYGYKISNTNKNKLVVDIEASLVVKKIFNLYLEGYGYMGIVRYLNDKGIPSPSYYKYLNGCKLNIVSNKNREDIKWNINTIKNILMNEVYIGNLIQGKRTTISYKNHKIRMKDKNDWIIKVKTHEAIISEDVFYKVREEIGKKRRVLKKNNKRHIFSGKVYCMECGMLMRKKNSLKHEYLECSNEKCTNKSIRYDKLEEIVLEKINNLIEKYSDYNEVERLYKEDIYNKKIKLLKYERDNINNKIIKIRNYMKKLYEDRVDGIISLELFNDLIRDYSKNIDDYNKKIEDVDRDINLYKDRVINIDKFKILDRIIIQEFIDKIDIGKIEDGERIIKIKWCF